MTSSIYETAADNSEYILLKKTNFEEECKTPPAEHFHNSVEFAFVTSGTLHLRINAEEKTLTRGDVAFINSFDVHRYTPMPDCEYFALIISSNFFDGKNRLGNIFFPPFMQKIEGFDKIIGFLEYSHSMWKDSSSLFKYGFVNMLLGLMQKFCPELDKPRDKQSEALVSALKYINESYAEKITLSSISAKYGYTANYFSFLFTRAIGMSLNEYLNRCRITAYKKIKEQSPDTPVSEAARSSGFSSLNTFYRAYKKYQK